MIASSKKNRRVASIVLIASMVILAGASKGSSSIFSGKRTISLERVGVGFELPMGFAIFQWESDEGGYYMASISVGKEFRSRHLKRVPFEMEFYASHRDCPRSSKPSECVDAEYERVKKNVQERVPGYRSDPEYIRLFGNKAVRYTRYGPNRSTIIIGYLRENQVPQQVTFRGAEEYLARITVTQDIPQAEFNKAYKKIIDAVINSLRTMK